MYICIQVYEYIFIYTGIYVDINVYIHIHIYNVWWLAILNQGGQADAVTALPRAMIMSARAKEVCDQFEELAAWIAVPEQVQWNSCNKHGSGLSGLPIATITCNCNTQPFSAPHRGECRTDLFIHSENNRPVLSASGRGLDRQLRHGAQSQERGIVPLRLV